MAGTAVGQIVQPGDEVRVEVAGASALTGPARDVFEDAVKSYATELLEEASRRELGYRSGTSTVPQYTTTHVGQAEDFVRNKGLTPPRRSRWFIVAKVVIYLLAALIGVSGNQMSQSQPWFIPPTAWLVTFFVALTAGLFLAIITEVIEFNKGRG